MKEIEAVAFDIDGTLYPNRRFYISILPFVIKNLKLMNAFGKVRKELRELEDEYPLKNFYQKQAELMLRYYPSSKDANYKDIDKIISEIEKKIYKGWIPLFKRLKPYPCAFKTIKSLKKSGFKIGLLSDFPTEQKGDVWGILPFCDCTIGSEATGALKPSPIPFNALAEKLNTPPEKILYVGNSVEYDMKGAVNAGMRTAYICSALKKTLSSKPDSADFWFSSYTELADFLLHNGCLSKN